MPQDKTEVQKFFEELPTNDQKIENLFENPDSKETVEKTEEKEMETPDNRQVRRMKEKLERERERAIALNDRVKELADEVSKYKQVMTSDTDERLAQIFGDDTPEKKALTKLFSEVIKDTQNSATEAALKKFEEKQNNEKEQLALESKEIDSEIEHLEDKYGVDLTSDTPQAIKARNNLIELVEKFSPKDAQGNITEYADFDSTFQLSQQMNKPDSSRNKELGAKTMQQSKTTDSSKDSVAAMEKYLNENGIRTR